MGVRGIGKVLYRTLVGFYNWSSVLNCFTPITELDTIDGSSNGADLFATISADPAPEPASVLLLATIGGMVAFSLRKRQKA
jgi:hypothetical protein